MLRRPHARERPRRLRIRIAAIARNFSMIPAAARVRPALISLGGFMAQSLYSTRMARFTGVPAAELWPFLVAAALMMAVLAAMTRGRTRATKTVVLAAGAATLTFVLSCSLLMAFSTAAPLQPGPGEVVENIRTLFLRTADGWASLAISLAVAATVTNAAPRKRR